jgi:hypothetical protein
MRSALLLPRYAVLFGRSPPGVILEQIDRRTLGCPTRYARAGPGSRVDGTEALAEAALLGGSVAPLSLRHLTPQLGNNPPPQLGSRLG